MATPLVKPIPLVEPFARVGTKNAIPITQGATPGQASFELGFPPETMTAVAKGGVPPSGLDFNGILNAITQHTAWLNAGGMYTFDSATVTATGGYKKGAVLQSDDALSAYISLVDNNTVNFNTNPASIGTQWSAYAGSAVNNGVTTASVTGGTLVLSAAQIANPIIVLTGTLTQALSVRFPAGVIDAWIVINSTTGAFATSSKVVGSTATPLTLSAGKVNTVFNSGTDLFFPSFDSGLDSPALRGAPTAPTQVQNDNSTKLATTEYADRAAAASVGGTTAQYRNANFAAGPTGDYWIDTTTGAFTMTLPDPPLNQNLIRVQDTSGTWALNPLTINAGSKTILGSATPLICDVSGEFFELWYNGTDWRLA